MSFNSSHSPSEPEGSTHEPPKPKPPVAPIVTCEHAGNEIPEDLQKLFDGLQETLTSHRGWDPGACDLANRLAERLDAPYLEHTISRLVIDVNRSLDRKKLFSEATLQLGEADRLGVIERFWSPHRDAVTQAVRDAVGSGETALHLGVHTFTPVLNNRVRRADIGLLYDPSREREKAFAGRLHEALKERRSDLRTRRNYPYFGKSDGLVTWLRSEFSAEQYIGFELEVNQKFPLSDDGDGWTQLQGDLVEAMVEAIESFS